MIDKTLPIVKTSYLEDCHFSELPERKYQKLMIAHALAQEPSVMIQNGSTVFLDWPKRVDRLANL